MYLYIYDVCLTFHVCILSDVCLINDGCLIPYGCLESNVYLLSDVRLISDVSIAVTLGLLGSSSPQGTQVLVGELSHLVCKCLVTRWWLYIELVHPLLSGNQISVRSLVTKSSV